MRTLRNCPTCESLTDHSQKNWFVYKQMWKRLDKHFKGIIPIPRNHTTNHPFY